MEDILKRVSVLFGLMFLGVVALVAEVDAGRLDVVTLAGSISANDESPSSAFSDIEGAVLGDASLELIEGGAWKGNLKGLAEATLKGAVVGGVIGLAGGPAGAASGALWGAVEGAAGYLLDEAVKSKKDEAAARRDSKKKWIYDRDGD